MKPIVGIVWMASVWGGVGWGGGGREREREGDV